MATKKTAATRAIKVGSNTAAPKKLSTRRLSEKQIDAIVDAKPAKKAVMPAVKPKKAVVPPTIAAKGKRGFAALAKGVPGSVLLPNAKPGIPAVEVRTVAQLRNALAEYPTSNTFTTDVRFGVCIIGVLNMRGRLVGEIHKKAK